MKDECQALQPEAVIAQAENATDLLSRLNNDLVATDRALASANATLAAHEAAGLAESLGEIESDLSLKRLEWSSLSRRAEAAKKLFEILADCRDKATWSYRAPLKAKAALSDCARRSRVLVSPESGVPVILDDALGHSDPERLEALAAVIRVVAERRHCPIILTTCSPEQAKGIDAGRRASPTPFVGR